VTNHRRSRGAQSVFVAVLGVIALVVAACGGGGGGSKQGDGSKSTTQTSASAQPVRGGSIVVGIEAETNGWLPGTANFSNAGINVALSIYDPLFRRDVKGEIRPYLAKSIASNPDHTVWTVELRPGVKFHDGTTLDAAAIKTDFDTYIKAANSNLAGQVKDITSVEAVGPTTVRYTLSQPNAAFPDLLAGAVGWPFSPTAAAAAGAEAGAKPVGTGPFMFDSWQRDSRLVVKRNPNYWQEGLPYLDEIVFRPIPDEDTRIASLTTGDIDVLQSLRQSAFRRVRDVAGVKSYENLGNNSGSAIFNTTKPPLDDVRIRRALAFALDQNQLVDVLGGTGLTPPQSQYFSKDSPYYSAKAAKAWPTNKPDEAKSLVKAYENDPKRSDGKAVGAPVALTFDCPPDPSLIELAQLYQSMWKQVGIDVNLNQVEQATHISQALAGDYQAKCWRVGSQDDPSRVFADAFGTGPLNVTNFVDPRIDEQVSVLRTTTDLAARQAAVEKISLVLDEKVPNTFTGGTLTTLAARTDVRNIDGWTFPDGTKGEGVPGATTMWAFVWRAK
jgi:peptide/nickel transport system substrate-binding protein